jgi:phage terminase small subunit
MSARKPAHLRVISGTDRPDRADTGAELPAEELLQEIPEPPAWLTDPYAVLEWMRLAPILIRLKFLTEGNLGALAELCACHGDLVAERLAGRIPTASSVGQYRALLVEFGLTPMSQGKLRIPGAEGDSGNKFQRNGSKPSR